MSQSQVSGEFWIITFFVNHSYRNLIHDRAHSSNRLTRMKTTSKRFRTNAKCSSLTRTWRSSAVNRSTTKRFTTTMTLTTWPVTTIRPCITSRCNRKYPFCPTIKSGLDSSRALKSQLTDKLAKCTMFFVIIKLFPFPPTNPHKLISKIRVLCAPCERRWRKSFLIEFNGAKWKQRKSENVYETTADKDFR